MPELPWSEACERNKAPILEALLGVLPDRGRVLEIGSCTGQHVCHFAPAFPGLSWQPSDQLEYLSGLDSRIEREGMASILRPLELDVQGAWPEGPYEVVFSANTAHIMGWPAVEAMFFGVGRVLAENGAFCLYGPFREKDGSMARSNETFDRGLRARDSAMGIRDLNSLEKLADRSHLHLERKIQMPANNQLLVFRAGQEILDD